MNTEGRIKCLQLLYTSILEQILHNGYQMLLSKCLQAGEKPSKQTFSKTLLMEAHVLGLAFWYIMLSKLNNNINFHISVFIGTGPATRTNQQCRKFTRRQLFSRCEWFLNGTLRRYILILELGKEESVKLFLSMSHSFKHSSLDSGSPS